jgi:hypothetical protein
MGGTATIQWVPDGSRLLLFDRLLVNPGSGAVVSEVAPEPKPHIERRFLDKNHLTTLQGTGRDQEWAVRDLRD